MYEIACAVKYSTVVYYLARPARPLCVTFPVTDDDDWLDKSGPVGAAAP